MVCPKCGLEQQDAVECSRCGIVIEKFRASSGRDGHPTGKERGTGGVRSPALPWNLLFTLLLVLGTALLLVSSLRKNAWPGSKDILQSVLREPVQAPTGATPFEVEAESVLYTITPRFSYELYGMVVSSHDCGAWWDIYHRDRWRDFLNIKDLCVIWGQNVLTGGYRDMKFSNDSWTCSCSWPNAEVGSRFAPACLSNNHLLCQDGHLKDLIMETSVGDQIYFKGYLAEYAHSNRTFTRGTSTSRTDTGNGACETVYVEDYQILRQANRGWRLAFRVSKYLILGTLVLLVIRIFRSPVRLRGS